MGDRVIEFDKVNINQIRLVPLTADPLDLKEGDVWYRGDTHTLKLRLAASTVTIQVA